jgi:UDP-glucose 4-epimerase
MKKAKEKVVVFGGTGFLGSHVADNLSERGFDVTIYSLEESLYKRDDQTVIIGDVLDAQGVENVIEGARYIYNFSGLADLDQCSREPLQTVQTNILGHTHILEGARTHKVERVVYASSVYVYSKYGSFYTISKQACEELTAEYAKRFNLGYTIVRYGSLYGPRAKKWNGVYRYLYQAMSEKRVDYPGSGDEKRKYIHVCDASRLSVDVLDAAFKNECVIINGDTTLSSHELLDMIREMMDGDIEINLTGKENFHHYKLTPYSFVPKMGKQLVPNPSIDFGEGLLQLMQEIHKEIEHAS